jgi:hypothetical protein
VSQEERASFQGTRSLVVGPAETSDGSCAVHGIPNKSSQRCSMVTSPRDVDDPFDSLLHRWFKDDLEFVFSLKMWVLEK